MPYPATVDPGRYTFYKTNVKDWGAIGDGVSDDTNAITNAINYVNTNGGGSVTFPAGTYITGTQLLYSKVHLYGEGIEATILKLKSATNADLLKGSLNGYGATFVNVAAANATGSVDGIYNWSLQDLTLDGNKAGQSGGPSYCLRQYGFGFIIQNVRMRNGYSGGILSDWNGGGNSGADSMEAQLVNVKVHDCGGIGLEWGGPHDSQMVSVLSFNNGTTGIHIGPNATAMLLANCHSFGVGQGQNACAFLIEGGYGQYVNCVSEGSDTCNTVILAGDTSWIGCHIFGIAGTPALQKTGMQLGQNAGGIPYAGSVYQAAGVTTALQATGTIVDGNFNLNNTAAINFVNEVNSRVKAICYNTSGNVIAGTPAVTSHYEIYMNGLAPDGTLGKGGGIRAAISAFQALLISDRTNDILNVNTFAKKLELVNACKLIIYTDAYGTKALETTGDARGTLKFAGDANATLARQAAGVLAFGGTLALAQSSSAAAIASNGTISISNVGVARVAPTGAVTGIKLTAGLFAGQQIIVVNESAFSVTFDVAANSFVADGVLDAIAANTAKAYVWSSGTSLWYSF